MLKPDISDLIRSSIRSILKNKGRTLLTSLGIIIGVTSVILLTSIGNGLKNYVSGQFEKIGSNLIYVIPGKVFNDRGGFNRSESGFITTSFTQKDVTELKRGLKPTVIFPISQKTVSVKFSKIIKKDISLIGSTVELGKNTNSLPSSGHGRWFTKEEVDKSSHIAVLGNQIAQDLFPSISPLGKKIIINGKNLQVVGVVDKKGSNFGGPSLDNHIFIPIDTLFNMYGDQTINTIYLVAPNKDAVNLLITDAKKIMLKRYDQDAFSIFDQSQLLSSINTILNTLTIGLTGIAAISLIVGGIGIMNIMLVTVTERTREIGLRKAVGAYPRAILLQFLFEAVILSCLGGTIGIILGTLGTLAIDRFFPAAITLSSVAPAFLVSSLVGIIFGVAPARKASKLSPIEALRYE